MSLNTTVKDNALEVKLSGRLGFEDHVEFKQVLDDFVSSQCHEIRFLLDDLAEVDSSGLGMFLLAKEAADDKGVSISLVHPKGQVKALFELSDFEDIFRIVA
ncbi:MAG: STAS domain-containing protein [Pseudomonadota bacterium]